MDEDLPEYVGTSRGVLAEPKRKRAAPAPVVAEPAQHPESYTGRTAPAVADGLADDDEPAAPIEPAPRVAVYNPPKEGAAHPRHAILGPALRVDEAEAALNRASLELTKATRHLRACELAESEAEASLMRELPGLTPDELLRQHVASQAKQRADRVAAGLNPDPVVVSKVGNSGLDRAAAQRPRQSPQMASAPLRSAVVRRGV